MVTLCNHLQEYETLYLAPTDERGGIINIMWDVFNAPKEAFWFDPK